MKYLIALTLVLIAVLAARAEIGSKVIMDGAGSNYVARGTANVLFVNRLSAGEHFGTTARTNVAYLATNSIAAVTATQCFLVVNSAAQSVTPLTNVYFVNRSADKVAWEYWTNVTAIFPSNGLRQAVLLPSLGQYPYVQLGSVSNISIAASFSNYVAVTWK